MFRLTGREDPVYLGRGSAADIWKINDQESDNGVPGLVLKKIRITPSNFVNNPITDATRASQTPDDGISWESFVKDYKVKVLDWSRLDHPNLVRVYDLSQDINLRVEFCVHGSVRDYLKAPIGQQANRVRMIGDVLQGLEYIHGQGIAHGSLNAGKIFVSAVGQVKIGEFGLAALCYHVALWVPSIDFGGFSRWMSPELLEVELEGNFTPTKESDMWALACVIWEIIYQKLPYARYKHDIQIQEAILDGEHPGDFDRSIDSTYGPEFRAALELCWSKDPFQRPNIRVVLNDYLRAQPQSGDTPSEQKPQKALTGKGLKMVTTGVAQSAADVLKFGPLRNIFDMFQGFADMYIMEGKVKNEYETLRQRLGALLKVLDGHSGVGNLPMDMSKTTEIHEFVEGQLSSIGNQQSGTQSGRFRMAKEEEERFLACCSRVQRFMDELTVDTSLSTSALIGEIKGQADNYLSLSLRIDKVEEAQLKDRMSSWISRLPSSPSAWYDSYEGAELNRRGCTLGTRADVLDNLLGWTTNDSIGGVYWLNGMAGTGKTTIAYSVCERLAEEHKLAASFFCSRLRGECRDVKMIIPSISYQLARRFPSFQSALSVIMKNDPGVHQKILDLQFKALIEEPLLAAQPPLPKGLVVVIDALDECDDKESTGTMLCVLLGNTVELSIKFIVSSRPEPEIRDQMSGEAGSRLVLHELDRGQVQADIEKYLRQSLAQIKPSDTEIAALVQRAGILFIYAATAVRYIGPDNPRRNPISRLGTILKGPQGQNTTQNKEIDQLYTTILESALDDEELEEAERVDMQQVLYTVICAREPLTVKGLSGLLRMNDVGRVRAALSPMWSVLHVVETSELVTTLHPSFPDFMFNPTRSKIFHCDSNGHNLKLAGHCFDHIAQTVPRFNLCGLESSCSPDDGVPNIKERVPKAISLELLYACRYWADHVEAGKCASSVANQLQEFLSTRLLLWMEVLNLSKQMKAGTDCMKLMVEWCNKFEKHQELVELAHDAKRFVEAFASNPVSQSTPHIYVSMLMFWPRATPIAKYYAEYTHGPVQAEGTALDRRQLAHLATRAFEEKIEAMALSSNEVSPFDQISCVKFSSDGARFVTGSAVGTIRIWDAQTGEMAAGPIKAHTGRINAVDFLKDRVVSGSNDGKICVCDTLGGEVVLGPLEVDSEGIHAIAYSPNGMLIATGSGRQVDVWDAQNGSRVLGPLTGLEGYVLSLHFSPNGAHIVASSIGHSKNMVVWNVSDGENVFGSLSEHWHSVQSVTYSPDGALIASGSNDETVIIWDTSTGKKAVGPLTGHSSWVCSVHFSPDSTRLVSGSSDRIIRVWDVQTGETVFELLSGHKDWITSVEYSPDGTRILSRSDDMSVRIHDARSPEERARSRSESEVGDWTMNKDGWVVDDQGRLLVWVPGNLRRSLLWPRTEVIVAPYGFVRLMFDKSRMGESWAKGFTSDS